MVVLGGGAVSYERGTPVTPRPTQPHTPPPCEPGDCFNPVAAKRLQGANPNPFVCFLSPLSFFGAPSQFCFVRTSCSPTPDNRGFRFFLMSDSVGSGAWQAILKWTFWGCGTNPATLADSRSDERFGRVWRSSHSSVSGGFCRPRPTAPTTLEATQR